MAATTYYGTISNGTSACELNFKPTNVISSTYEDYYYFEFLCDGYAEISYLALQKFKYSILKNNTSIHEVFTNKQNQSGYKLVPVSAGDTILIKLYASGFVFKENDFFGTIRYIENQPTPTPTPSPTQYCGITINDQYLAASNATYISPCSYLFNLKSNSSNITGISSEKAIILINDVFQGPGLTYDYTLNETAGITSIRFTGTATSFRSDVNTSNLPIGGVIISVGSSQGFGYQPLVSAGGTAIVSIAGTISSISIGNSGSGYRSGSQIVRVGVGTSSTGTPKIEFIGTAVVSNGRIVSVAITNPGSGYTSTKAPYVVIDDPLSYSDIPLKYTSSSSGFGTEATVDVVVGSGSSIIEFELKNNGYGYGQGDILTIPIGIGSWLIYGIYLHVKIARELGFSGWWSLVWFVAPFSDSMFEEIAAVEGLEDCADGCLLCDWISSGVG
jgi:hypothetical protein